MREWSLSGIGVRTPGSYTFSSCFGHQQKFCVSFKHRDASLCVRPRWWSDICRRIFCLQGEFCNHQVKTALWKNSGFGTNLWVSPGESVLNKVTGYPHICSDEWNQLSCILCVPPLKWAAELITSLPLAPGSSTNCSFFQSSSEKCWAATAPLQVSAERRAATSLGMYRSRCPVWEGRCQPRRSMDSTGMVGFFSCNFSLRHGRISARDGWRWEAGLAPSELLVRRCCSKSL